MMDDRISTLPECILCYILSLMPTKDAVATCILSKHWKHLWRSVPALDFECGDHGYNHYKKTNFSFDDSVHAFVHSRHIHLSLQRFSVSCCSLCYPVNVTQLLAHAASQNSENTLERLDLSLSSKTVQPFTVLSCKTLVVIKLHGIPLEAFSSVDLPSLKILSLIDVLFSEYRLIGDLLSGCPNLEDLTAVSLCFRSYVLEAKFKKLPKLIRANVEKSLIPLEVVSNVQFLHLKQVLNNLICLTFLSIFKENGDL